MTLLLALVVAAALAIALVTARTSQGAGARQDFASGGAPSSGGLAPKFPVGDEPSSDPALPPGHPDIAGQGVPGALADDSSPLPSGHPPVGEVAGGQPSPHGAASDALGNAAQPLAMPKIDRASGGRRIAELALDRQKLAGQRVRVRGQVTKVTPDVQGHAFFHLRDTDLAGQGGVTDLVVTSLVAPQRGQVATFEGTLRADHDIGIGYQYPVLLEDATVVDP